MRGMESFGHKETFGALLSFPADNFLACFFLPAAGCQTSPSWFSRFEPASSSLGLFILVSAFICQQLAQQPIMDIEKGTDLQRTATGQQDQGESGKITQKNKPIEQQATQPVPGFSEAGGAWGDNHSKTNLVTIPS